MKKISLILIILLSVFYSCKNTDKIIKNTKVQYIKTKDVTVIDNSLIENPIEIHGKWSKTNYEEEFSYKQRDYFLYLKDVNNILGVYVKPNKTRIDEEGFEDDDNEKRKYFRNSISKEINHLKEVGVKYVLINTDKENYQTYKYRGVDNIQFYGIIGIKNKKVCYLSVYNNNLNEKEKEDLLIKLFLDMNT